ncbi:hypothetical protein [Vibrio breoganii]|uniref:hypothetical protein n=1 Tax=Vibrio breoganii TaxID=553239 RepID=UPI000C84B726|nr:hypothetical protein [Vibrio breoganii]PMG94676.1 hypothetical protein BCU79_01075 [Vibrio breoganii]PMK41085.1 hypothetical protein BCU00_01830 [Vibrio breoganii]
MKIYVPLTPFQLLQSLAILEKEHEQEETIFVILRTCVSFYKELAKSGVLQSNIKVLIFSEDNTSLSVTSRSNYPNILKFINEIKKETGTKNHIITGSDDNFFVKILYRELGTELSLCEDGTGSFVPEILTLRKKVNLILDQYFFRAKIGSKGLSSSKAIKLYRVNDQAFSYRREQAKIVPIKEEFSRLCSRLSEELGLPSYSTIVMLPPWNMSEPNTLSFSSLEGIECLIKCHPRETDSGINNWKGLLDERRINFHITDKYQLPMEVFIARECVVKVVALDTSTTMHTAKLFHKEFDNL